MKSFYSNVRALGLVVLLQFSVPGRASTDFAAIERLTNLKPRAILDFSSDYAGDDGWSFGKFGHNLDLLTLGASSGTFPGLTTAGLADHARRGRVRNLGPLHAWTARPELPPFELGSDPDQNWIVLTDLEPDDRLALIVLSRTLPRSKILAVGANLLNAPAKALRTRTLLDQLGWDTVPVLTGNGGAAADYPDLASNAAARSFEHHDAVGALSSDQTQAFIQDALSRAEREGKRLNFLVLSPGTDLANAILSQGQRDSALEVIRRVVMVGGWVEVPNPAGPELRSTYNTNMDPWSTRLIFEHLNVELVSSHLIKPTFGGGSVNAVNAPGVVEAVAQSLHPAVADLRDAGLRWDRHLIATIPALAAVVGPHAGRQFTPADVVAAALVTDPELSTRVEEVGLTLDVHERTDRGFRVTREDSDPRRPRARVTEAIDAPRFLRTLERVIRSLGCARALESGG